MVTKEVLGFTWITKPTPKDRIETKLRRRATRLRMVPKLLVQTR